MATGNRQYTTHFDRKQFQDASDAPLTEGQDTRAAMLSAILEAIRRQFGVVMIVTSFVRHDGTPHSEEGGGWCVDVSVAGNDPVMLAAMWKWAAQNLTTEFGKLIFENHDHLHITLPGFQGAYGQVLQGGDKEGGYAFASFAPLALLGGNLGVVAALLTILGLVVWAFND